MVEIEWMRIPVPIKDDADRRAICGMLAAYGLEVRIVKVQEGRGTPKRFVEYRDTGISKTQKL